MADNNKNPILDIGKTAFSFFSFKTKMIVIGVVIGVFLIIIVPVVAITSIFTPNTKNSSEKKGGGSSSDSSSTSVTNTKMQLFQCLLKLGIKAKML